MLGKSPLKVLTFLAVFALAATCFLPLSQAQSFTYNEINGRIVTNLTLTKANGPYLIGEVVVEQGVTLTIQAGASINFAGYLTVKGTLIAQGTASDKIWFNMADYYYLPIGYYFGPGLIEFTSSSKNSIIENAILSYVAVSTNSSVTIKNSYLRAGQGGTTLSIAGGSPLISGNTLEGSLDSNIVIGIEAASPTITNNKIVAFVDNGLLFGDWPGVNRFGSAYGIYGENVNGAQITNNKFYGPFRDTSIMIVSGAATVSGNDDNPTDSADFPTSSPPPPTPTPVPTPTLPIYGGPTETGTYFFETASPTQMYTGPVVTVFVSFEQVLIAVVIAAVVIISLLTVIILLLAKRNRKTT